MLLPTRERSAVIKTPSIVLAVMATLFMLLALFLLGRLLDSAAELVRFLRATEPTGTSGVTSAADASSLDTSPSPSDASRAGDVFGSAPRRTVTPGLPAEEPIDDAEAPSPPSPAPEASAEDGAVASPEDAAPTAAAPPSEPPQPVRCGFRICSEGQVCCNWDCSICTPPGQTCSSLCGAPTLPISVSCGPNTCDVTEICCNRSCGICVRPGGTCSQQPCESMYDPVSPTCGMNTCNVGQWCCNPSCGTCTNPGESCNLDPCP